MAESAEYDVFISSGPVDRGVARQLAGQLRESGLSVSPDDDRLLTGRDSLRAVEDAMRRSKAIAVLVSSRSDPAGAWSNEVELAIDMSRDGKALLIPVFLDNPDPSALPLGLRRFSGVYARTDDELEAGVAAIAKAVQERRSDRAVIGVHGAIPPRPRHYFESSEVDHALSAVREALAERDGPVWLTGGAGVGKSVVASEVCRRLSAGIDVVWWTTATSEESIVGGLASLSQALDLVHSSPGTLRDYAREALAFLASGSVSWLLVLDDVVDEKAFFNWLPTSYNTGTCLVTSRLQPSERHRQRIVVINSLSSEDAVRYLRGLLPDVGAEDSSEQKLRGIANALGGHPLALRLAASSISSQRSADPNRLSELLAQLTSAQPVVTSSSVADSLKAALAHASVRHPAARALLNAMGWLSNKPFPIAMFRGASDDPFLSSTPAEITAAIDALGQHGLVYVDHDLVSAHDVIREFARSTSTDAVGFLLRLLVPAFANPESPDNWGLCASLYPHVLELSRLIAGVETLHVDAQRESVELRVGTARYLAIAGSSDDALALLHQTLADSERIFGSDHPSTLSVRSNLASMYQSLGRYVEAAALLQQTLAGSQRILGGDHPSTLSARANLAGIYQSLGRYDEAAALLQQTLADSRRILGSDHPSTLSVQANLAGIYQHDGRYEEAVALLQQTLAESERILGDDHPSTLTVRANLAGIYQSLGRHDDAVALLEQTLADSRRVLGSDHPSTLTVQANLAFVASHGHND